MGTTDQVESRVIELIRQIAPAKLPVVSGHHHLVDDLSFDSISLLELAVAIEAEFDLPAMSPADTSSLLTVQQLQDRIIQLVGAKPK